MQIEKYPFRKMEENHCYEFYSIGPKGKIKKRIEMKCSNPRPVPMFNLGFGDWDEIKNEINDEIVTNNNDRTKVLSTVAAAVLDFIKERRGGWIHAKGSTPARTRLYQMGINLVWDEIKDKLELWGESNNQFEKFSKGINYHSFLLKSNS